MKKTSPALFPYQRQSYYLQQQTGQRNDLFEDRYEHSHIRLLRSQELPSTSLVSELLASSDRRSPRLDLDTLVNTAAKLGGLSKIALELYDNETKYPGRRLKAR